MEYTRRHRGVCSRASMVEINEDGVITAAKIIGGCDGNTRGLSQIVVGLPAKFVIEKWKGTPCMYKATSCPDQFAITIEEALAKMEEEIETELEQFKETWQKMQSGDDENK